MTLTRDRAPSRRGFGGVLAVVMLVLLCGGLVAAARQVHASHVTGSAQTAIAGDLAREAAEAAVEEALVAIGERANTPGDKLYEHLRQEGIPGPTELTVPAPTTTELLSASPDTAGVKLTGPVKVQVLERRRIGISEADHDGRVRLTAAAVHKATGVMRRVIREHALRVNLVSTPRPYDQLTWAAVTGERLLDPDGNTRMQAAVDALKDLRTRRAPAMQSDIRLLVPQINRVFSALQQGRSDAQQMDAEQLANRFAPESYPAPPDILRDITAPFHFLPQEVVLGSKAKAEDLRRLNLRPPADHADRLSAQATERADSLDAKYKSTRDKLTAGLHEASARTRDAQVSLAAIAEWVATVQTIGNAYTELGQKRSEQLGVYRSYEDATIELSEDARDFMLDNARQFDAPALYARAAHRFSGPGAARKALAFVRKYDRRGLATVIFVDNRGDDPLVLSSVSLHGKITLAATGHVKVSDVRLADRSTDLLVVRAGGRLEASGRVEASLIAHDEFIPGEDLDIAGNLILCGAFEAGRLRGHVDRDGGRYASGVSGQFHGEYSQAALSPYALFAFVERSNP